MIEPLSDRELEILTLIRNGLSNQDIADTLCLSKGTIKAHNHNIYGKLGVTSRTQAILRAEELGLLETADTDDIADNVRLPLPLNPLIGREEELETLSSLLDDPYTRLVTIFGAGGMGKTHLALEVADRNKDKFTGGVFFVSLASVMDATNIASTIIDNIGLEFHNRTSITQQLFDFLKNKRVLLLLDNFEHLLGGADFITTLLQAAPDLKLLITSRERLNLSTEVLFVLEGLNYAFSMANDNLLEYDAVKLLINRAEVANPNFVLTPQDRAAVEEICRLTQGMPLALMLASSWLEMLTLEEIADEISSSINILESQMRDVPERQRSMRATIASSWRRLSTEEQRVFASLAVFRGGFTRSAADKIASTDLQKLKTLVNRSLLSAKNGRYEVHELLRQYGLEELEHATRAAHLFNEHSRHYLRWLCELEGDLKGRRQADALKEVNLDIDNIRQAWQWAVRMQKFERIDQALETVFISFLILNRYEEGAALMALALNDLRPVNGVQKRVMNRLQLRYYRLILVDHHHEISQSDIERCIAQAGSDPVDVALGKNLLASYLTYETRDFERAIDIGQSAIITLVNVGETFHLASVYHDQAYRYLQLNGMETLIKYVEKEYELARKTGNIYNQLTSLSNLGSAALYLGRYHEAESYYRESTEKTKLFGDNPGRSRAIYFTHILFLLGKFEEGNSLLNSAWGNQHSGLEVAAIGFGYAMQGFIHVLKEQYELALQHAMRGLREANQDRTATLVSHWVAAMAYCGLEDGLRAEEHLFTSWAQSQQMMNYYAAATWGLPVLVITAAQQGRFDDAVMYSALVRTHPLSATDWLDSWHLLVEAEAVAKSTLNKDAYAEAWDYGENLSLEEVVSTRLAYSE